MYISDLISFFVLSYSNGENFRLEMKLSVCKYIFLKMKCLISDIAFKSSITTYYMALESKWRMRRIYFAHGNMK